MKVIAVIYAGSTLRCNGRAIADAIKFLVELRRRVMRITFVPMILVACMAGCGQPSATSHEQALPTATPPSQPALPTHVSEQTLEVTAEQFGKELDGAKNWDVVGDKYRGKKLRVAGTVGSVVSTHVYLATKANSSQLVMPFGENKEASVHTRDHITVECEFNLFSATGPAFKNCKLIDIKPYKPLAVKATELTKEYVADEGAAETKYPRGELLIEGTVKSVAPDNKSGASVVLAGHDDNTEIDCVPFRNNEVVKTKIKVGQTIKLKGHWHGLTAAPDKRIFLLYGPELVE